MCNCCGVDAKTDEGDDEDVGESGTAMTVVEMFIISGDDCAAGGGGGGGGGNDCWCC